MQEPSLCPSLVTPRWRIWSAGACSCLWISDLNQRIASPLTPKFLYKWDWLRCNGDFSIVRADPNSRRGWRSQYYGEKEPAISVMLETDQASATILEFLWIREDNVIAKIVDSIMENRLKSTWIN